MAIGNFDGVHLGHRRIAERLLERAREVGGPAIVFTFDPHPVRLLRPSESPPPLTWTERKAQLLKEIGVDWVVAYPTDQRLLQLTAQQFFDQIVVDAVGARAMVEGPNFYFGHNREGTIERLGQMTDQAGMTLDIVRPVELDGQLVSSSLIRRLIGAGEVAAAATMLTEPYRIRGMVTHGAGRGSHIGFPTANLEAIDTLLPAVGVYAGRVPLGGKLVGAAINIGPNPTFGEQAHKVEVHLIDREESLYGEPLEVEFLSKLRDVRAFGSKEELIAQLREDVSRAREIAG
ncbi:FMN adenylyltransferase [Lacipirellula parvula]|uniref:Riboflavin biosynthesis protein n=2 Tax=Lacipirellula parvula TaxID=2650471 RepID=A0A5K7XG26_9BACT|nr:FMN adenylyltransferase [Lacipirellula parvula]